MATQVQLRRGTSAQNDAFTGATGELTYDTTNKRVRVHDGGTAGGFEIKTEDGSGNTIFADNEKAIFGAGSDLEIFHNGSHSIISEGGTGNLRLQGNNLALETSGGTSYLTATNNGAVSAFYAGSQKLATTSTGIDVTGGFNATDGCTITTADNTAQLTLTSTDADASRGPILDLYRNSSSPADNDIVGTIQINARNDNSQDFQVAEINFQAVDVSDGTEDGRMNFSTMLNGTARARITVTPTETAFNEDSRDLDFRVESDSNTHMLFVDGGNNRIGINESSPDTLLHLSGTNSAVNVNNALRFTDADTAVTSDQVIGRIEFETSDLSNPGVNLQIDGIYGGSGGGSELVIKTGTAGSLENRMFIQDSETVFNEDGGNNDFRIESDSNANMLLVDAGNDAVNIGNNDNAGGDLNVIGTATGNGVASTHRIVISSANQYGSNSNPKNLRLDFVGYRDGAGDNGIKARINAAEVAVDNRATTLTFDVNNSGGNLQQFLSVSYADVVFNNPSNDLNFRVESDSNSNMLFVDAGNNTVGIGNGTPAHPLSVRGTTQILAGDNIAGSLANGATADIITSVPRGFSYVNISRDDTASGGLLLLLYSTTTTTTIVSTVSDQTGSAYSASTSGRALRVTNSTGGTISFYASCMNLAWVSGG